MIFASLLFNTQLKSLNNDGHIFTFRNVMFALLLRNKEDLKGLEGESNVITVTFIQSADFLFISSDTLK